MESVELADGRELTYSVNGAPDGRVLVWHHGTPGSGRGYRVIDTPAAERGLRVVWPSRPGYAGSTRHEGRAVVDVADDLRQLLTSLGVEEFIVGGSSGGGPHALACAARVPGCRAAATVVGLAPWRGAESMAGMGEDNVEEFTAAMEGPDALRAYLEEEAKGAGDLTAAAFAESHASLLPQVDREALTGEFAEDVTASLRAALSTGIDGWFDDDLEFVRPWGFELDEITTPVALWHGTADQMSPVAQARVLAATVPGVIPHIVEGEGHLSIYTHAGEMLDELLELAGW